MGYPEGTSVQQKQHHERKVADQRRKKKTLSNYRFYNLDKELVCRIRKTNKQTTIKQNETKQNNGTHKKNGGR